jgi:TolB-like protein/cytochrome c-type biogenesis protein CcmH/NrfG
VNSIAVLPFASRSPDTADVYLAEGMTEEVGNRLTQLGRLVVTSRGVVAAQWRRNPDALAAARALRVAWFVHGNVRHVAGQLLVNVELVRATTGEEVWASRFPRRDTDVFAVQAEVAESVAAVVAGRLSQGERVALTRRPTRSNEAYRLYLYGNSLFRHRTQLETRRAVEAYTEAVRLDPGFAAAWARLSLARGIQSSWSEWREAVSGDSLRALGRAAAQRALQLDSASGEAWLAVAFARANRDLAEAHAAFERAIYLDSLNPEAYHLYGASLYAAEPTCSGGCLNDYASAAPLFRRALALDPGLRNTWRHLAEVTRDAGRLADAEALLDTAASFGPWAPALRARAYVRFLRGNGVGALADLSEAARLDSMPREDDRAMFRVLLGDSTGARAELDSLRAGANSDAGVLIRLARLSMALGRRGEALAAVERLRALPDPEEPRCSPTTTCSVSVRTWALLHDPIFAPLRGEPRFERLWAETRPRVPWLEARGR